MTVLSIQPYEIGKFYRVPVVRAQWQGKFAAWPVLGGFHEDAQIIQFEPWHYHMDARFMTDRQWKFVLWAGRRHKRHEDEVFSGVITFEIQPRVEPEMRLRKCRRAYPSYPHRQAPWMRRLDSAFQDRQVDERLVCPHKGASLVGS